MRSWSLAIWQKKKKKKQKIQRTYFKTFRPVLFLVPMLRWVWAPSNKRTLCFKRRRLKGVLIRCNACIPGEKKTTNFFLKVVHNLRLSLDGSNFWTENLYTFHVLIFLCSSWINELVLQQQYYSSVYCCFCRLSSRWFMPYQCGA